MLFGALVLSACTSDTLPTGGGGGADLSGTWLVAGSSPTFAVDGARTVTFSGPTSGILRFLGRSDDNGVTTCRSYVFALVDDTVLFVQSWQHDPETFVIESANASSVTLVSDASNVTLTRVAGSGPVDDCGTVDLETLATLDAQPTFWANLVGTAGSLYFNLDTAQNPIVGFDLTTATFGAPRAFTVSVGGGTHRYALAAFDDDIFYGHCACGGSQSVSRFNVETDTHLVQVDSDTDLGAEVGFRYGTYDGAAGTVMLGGRSRDDFTINRLFVLDAVTLGLISQRTILPDESINDLTIMDGRLFALLGSENAIVEIGAGGTAVKTWEVPRNAVGGELRGIEAVAGTMYLLVDDWVAGRAIISTIDLE